jgi:hypothetical protein
VARADEANGEPTEPTLSPVGQVDDPILGRAQHERTGPLRHLGRIHRVVVMRVDGHHGRESSDAGIRERAFDTRNVRGDRPIEDQVEQARSREEAIGEDLRLPVVEENRRDAEPGGRDGTRRTSLVRADDCPRSRGRKGDARRPGIRPIVPDPDRDPTNDETENQQGQTHQPDQPLHGPSLPPRSAPVRTVARYGSPLEQAPSQHEHGNRGA